MLLYISERFRPEDFQITDEIRFNWLDVGDGELRQRSSFQIKIPLVFCGYTRTRINAENELHPFVLVFRFKKVIYFYVARLHLIATT